MDDDAQLSLDEAVDAVLEGSDPDEAIAGLDIHPDMIDTARKEAACWEGKDNASAAAYRKIADALEVAEGW